MGNQINTEKPPQDLFERRSVRWILFIAIPAVIFILVCAGIRISQYGINHTILVLGQKELVAGWPAAIRVTLIADDGRFFLPTRLAGHLVRNNEKHLLFDGPIADRGYALACNFRLKDIAPGPAELELDIHFDDKRRIVRSKVEVVAKPPKEVLDVPNDAAVNFDIVEVKKEDVRMQAFTEDRGAPTGLTSVIFMRSLNEKDNPVAADFEIELSGESRNSTTNKEFRTDRLGLFALPIKPLELALPIRVSGSRTMLSKDSEEDAGIEVDEKDAYLFPKIVYAGITAAVHNPIVVSGAPLRISAQQISPGGPVYADLFYKGRWVQAASSQFVSRSTSLEIRPVMNGLGRVQITTSPLAPGRTVAVRHFYAMDENEDLNDGLRRIFKSLESSEHDLEWAKAASAIPLEQGSGFDRRLAAAFALSRLYAGHQTLPTLISSRREDDAELNEFKAKSQRGIMLAILFIGLGVALLITTIAIQSHQRHERISIMILSEDTGNDEPEWRTDMGEKASKRHVLLQGAILFLIILGAFTSIALLVDTLTWHR
ncbi:MAG: hypothetical protein GY847_34280 [Proteobacteria bacterium]|nr:hypothetical protein [Pseudomonadota bacterium]